MKKVIVICLVLFFLTAAVFAQSNAQSLQFGTPVRGELAEEETKWYSIRHNTGSFITIETTGKTDTMLEIYDNNNLIAQDDDSGENLNACLELYIDANKTYTIKLTSYGGHAGYYIIQANQRILTSLNFNSPIRGDLSGSPIWYSVRAASTGIITVETTGDLDTYLEAYDSSNNLLESNDDGGIELNAKLEILAESGQTYLFKLRGYDSDETGPFTITATFEVVPPDALRNIERSRATAIRLGEPIPVRFYARNESRWYSYTVPRGESNILIQTRGDLDTLLYLYDSRGILITSDDDSGEDYNALINERLEAGTYFIEVKPYSGLTGHCTLHAEIR